MIAGGIIMIVFGVGFLTTGIILESNELIRLASFFALGSTHPGVLFIILGALLLIGGVLLLVFGIKRDKERKARQLAMLNGSGPAAGGPPPLAGYPAHPPVQPAPGAYPGEFRVQGVTGAFAGKRFRIERHTVLGRDVTRCQLVFPEHCTKVSRAHCELWVEGGAVMLKDLGSTHGTFLESGAKLQPNVPVRMNIGSRFWLGDRSETLVITPKGGL